MGGKAEGGLGVGVQAGQSGVAGIQQKIACLADAAAQGYDLSLNRYKELVYEEVEHRSPDEIADGLAEGDQAILPASGALDGDKVRIRPPKAPRVGGLQVPQGMTK